MSHYAGGGYCIMLHYADGGYCIMLHYEDGVTAICASSPYSEEDLQAACRSTLSGSLYQMTQSLD